MAATSLASDAAQHKISDARRKRKRAGNPILGVFDTLNVSKKCKLEEYARDIIKYSITRGRKLNVMIFPTPLREGLQ